MSSYPVLGAYTQPVRTTSTEAQRWFDRGMMWVINFHREEASFCFAEAAAADPNCAMAYWGIALANGPDYNFSQMKGFYTVAAKPTGYPSLKVAADAIATAAQLTANSEAPPREKALIEALATRYEWPTTDETPARQQTYADAMVVVADQFLGDPDVHAVCAEALMCLAPWDLYEKAPGATTPNWYAEDKRLKPVGVQAKRVLDRGMSACPSHPWLCHLKVRPGPWTPPSLPSLSVCALLRARARPCSPSP